MRTSLTTRRYQAFISYSHSGERAFARLLQRTLESFGSTFGWRRRMRVFRDETNLAASPDLWSSVESALDQSDYLILLASPSSAASAWVDREIQHFLERNPLSRLGIVLVAGTSAWTDVQRSPDTNAISPTVQALFGEQRAEPLVIDLREFTAQRRTSRHDPEFLGRVASVVAAILGTDKDQVYGEHIRAQRRAIGGLTGGLATIAALAVVALIQYRLADRRLSQAVAVARHINEVVEERLAPIAGASTVRRDLLKASAVLLDDLLGQRGGSRPAVALQRIEAHVRRGFLALDYEAPGAGARQFDSALAIAVRFPIQVRDEWAWTREVIRARRGRGDAFEARGDLASAFTEFELARTIAARFAGAGDDSLQAKRQVSVALSRQLAVHMARGNLVDASRLVEDALGIDASLVNRYPNDVSLRSNLAATYVQAGDLALQRYDLKNAGTYYSRAETILDPLIQADSINADLQSSWVEVVIGQGIVLLYAGQRESAGEQFARARSRIGALVQREPEQVLWRRMLSAAVNNIASTYAAVGERAVATSGYQQALAILDTLLINEPTNVQVIADQTEIYQRLGDLAWENGDYAGAQPYYDRYRGRTDSLHRQDPGNLKWAYNLATAHERLGNLWSDGGKLSLARQSYAALAALIDTVIRRQPDSWEWHFLRANSVEKQAETAELEGDAPKAIAAYRTVIESLDSLRLKDTQHLNNLATLGYALTRLGAALVTAESLSAALVPLQRAESLYSTLLAQDSSQVDWGAEFVESSSRIAQIHIVGERYDAARPHLDRCLGVARRMVASHPRTLRAIQAASTCQSRVGLLAVWQDRDSDWVASSTELFIQRAQIVALAPDDPVDAKDFQTTRETLLSSLASGDTVAVRRSVQRLASAASGLSRTLPAAARLLNTVGAGVAMDILGAPELALRFTAPLNRSQPNDPAVSCNHAEVLLALWRDAEEASAGITRCSLIANTPPLRVVGHALALQAAVLRHDSAAIVREARRLTPALEALGAGSVEWDFSGLKRALQRRRAEDALILVFEALALRDPKERRERLAGALQTRGLLSVP